MAEWGKPPVQIKFEAHKTRHEDAGADEINLEGLSGVPADVVAIADVDDEPVPGAETSPISSNWASEAEEDLAVSKNLLKGLMNAICEDDFSWDEFDPDEVDVEDIEEMVEEGIVTSTDFNSHKDRHEKNGDDEVDVTGLSGLLADDQHVLDSEVKLVFASIVCYEDDVVCNNNEVVYN